MPRETETQVAIIRWSEEDQELLSQVWPIVEHLGLRRAAEVTGIAFSTIRWHHIGRHQKNPAGTQSNTPYFLRNTARQSYRRLLDTHTVLVYKRAE